MKSATSAQLTGSQLDAVADASEPLLSLSVTVTTVSEEFAYQQLMQCTCVCMYVATVPVVALYGFVLRFHRDGRLSASVEDVAIIMMGADPEVLRLGRLRRGGQD